jgi:hypothetical protein
MAGLSFGDRRTFLEQLSQAGWDVEDWDLVRVVGARVDLQAEAEYQNASSILRLELPTGQPYMVFQMSQLDGELVLRLRIYPRDDLAKILHEIIAAQDALDNDTHPQLLKALFPLSKRVLIETDEGLFALS